MDQVKATQRRQRKNITKVDAKIFFAVAIMAVCLTAHADSNEKKKDCLNYETDSVSLDGVVDSEVFPGPPNYEDITKGDKPDKQWLLKLDKKICIEGNGKDDPNMEPERDIEIIQLSISKRQNWSLLKSRKGSRVKIEGKLYHAYSAHHRTKVLLSVKNIE